MQVGNFPLELHLRARTAGDTDLERVAPNRTNMLRRNAVAGYERKQRSDLFGGSSQQRAALRFSEKQRVQTVGENSETAFIAPAALRFQVGPSPQTASRR